MTFYIRQGSALRITDKANLQIEDRLPPGNYYIKFDPRADEFYLDRLNDFELPPKLYGSTSRHADRILSTFKSRQSSTGVLLAGEKGSGKSLLAKLLAVRCAEAGMPTLVIADALHGEKFNAFVQSIDQPAVVLFDEFEKVYDREEQTAMLTLLDGMYPTKKLFVLTCNDAYRIDSHMTNRPGRLFYSLEFTGLEEAEIRGYCADQLENKLHIDSVVKYASFFRSFNFDMLKSLVEEMNRYGESVQDATAMLNAKPGSEESEHYFVSLFDPHGRKLKVNHPTEWRGAPLTYDSDETQITLVFEPPQTPEGRPAALRELDEVLERTGVNITRARQLKNVIGQDTTQMAEFVAEDFYPEKSLNGAHAFKNKDGFVAVFTPKQRTSRNYYGAY